MILADFWSVSGWVMTVLFGGLSVFQFVRDYIRGRVWNERAKNLVAVKMGLGQLRSMLTEAEATGEVIKTDSQKQFIRQLGHHIRSIESNIDLMLEPSAPTKVNPPSS